MAVWPSNGQIFVCATRKIRSLDGLMPAVYIVQTDVEDTLAKRSGTDVASAFLTTLNRPQWPAP